MAMPTTTTLVHQQHKHLLGEMALQQGELERWAGRNKK
jgi:hypothetical protein